MSSSGVEPPVAILEGRFLLQRVIGVGDFGKAYAALDTRLQRTVAIKELLATSDPRLFNLYVDRFQREARAAGGLFHSNIVNVFELAIDDHNNYYLIMEFVERGNLRDLLQRIGTLPVERALQITLDIARALEAIHEVDIVHRDLKPANIMLTQRGAAKLTDFGIAQIGTESQRTQIGVAHPGTPLYMSPEQRQNTDYLDGRSDLFSLGLVLYEMLTGEPFARRKLPLLSLRPDVSPTVVRIFDRLTERELERRYRSAEEVIADLEVAIASESQGTGTAERATGGTLIDGRGRAAPPGIEQHVASQTPNVGTLPLPGPEAAYPPVPPLAVGPTPPTRSRTPAILGIVGGLVIVLAVLGGWFFTQSGKQTVGSQTATPVAGNGPTPAASVPVTATQPPPATVSATASTPPTPIPTGTPTQAPPTLTPTAPPTVRPSATTRPDFQMVANQKYGIAFAYPKAWQRSDDETDQDTIFAFRISPSAAFLVAKEDNPTATTLDSYIDDEIKVETTQRPGWKAGSRAHQPTMLGGQPAQIADFLVPTATGQDYHYYVFTLRPKQAWGLLFSMSQNDFTTYQKDIDDIVRSFVFCAGGTCPTPSAQVSVRSADVPVGLLNGALPRRQVAIARAPQAGRPSS